MQTHACNHTRTTCMHARARARKHAKPLDRKLAERKLGEDYRQIDDTPNILQADR